MAGIAQSLSLAAGLDQHPVTYRYDHSGFLGDANESARLHESFFGILPAHQSFHSGHVARGDLHLRLKLKHELVPFQCAPQG